MDAEGVVSAKSQGVATVTATVEYNGKSVSGSYSLKVMPDLSLSELKVAGKSILKSGLREYSFIGKASSKAPQVSAKSVDPSLRVVVEQAPAVPGTAAVRVIDDITSRVCILCSFRSEGCIGRV